jgi:hypothetical protein
MSQVLNISLDYTQLMEKAKAAHSAFNRGKNGHAYLSISVWVNDLSDEYGNDVSAQLNSKKEKREAEGVVFVGNGRTAQAAKVAREKRKTTSNAPVDDLPF